MFHRTAVLVLACLGTLASAGPVPGGPPDPKWRTASPSAAITTRSAASQCAPGTGSLECCSSIVPASNPAAAMLLQLLGVDPGDPNAPIGLNCSPLDSANSCSSVTACCQNNSFNGLIAINCSLA